MPISHNLSSNSDNLSGFDPVAGESDGTTIGKTYVMWQLFQGLVAFDSRVKIITGGSPTPAWLQSSAGSITSAPAKNTSTNSATIRFYYNDDPGLSAGTPHCKIYEFKNTSAVTNYQSVFWFRMLYMISGGVLYNPVQDICYELSSDITTNFQAYIWEINGGTTTLMANIPKVIFWKNANTTMMMGVGKAAGAWRGMITWVNSGFVGYKHTVGAVTEGVDVNLTVAFTASGTGVLEGISGTYNALHSAISSDVSILSSAGNLPAALFTYSSNNNLVGSNLWVGAKNDTIYKVITTSALEGILLAANPPASSAPAAIYKYNTKYYLHGNLINDGRTSFRPLYELGT